MELDDGSVSSPAAQEGEDTNDIDEDAVKPYLDAHDFVKERAELSDLVHQLCDADSGPYEADKATRIKAILEKYQEQATLLDPHLPHLVGALMTALRNFISSGATDASRDPRTTSIFRTVYLVCKVRGAQTVARLFPHEVVDLERTFDFLCAQKRDEHTTWEVRYVCLLWLSIIALVPFNLDTIDSKSALGMGRLQDRLLSVAKTYLSDSGLTSNAAAALLSTLFSRPDYDSYMDEFFRWSASILLDPEAGVYFLTGIYTTLIGIFNRTARSALLPRVGLVIQAVFKPAKLSTNNKKMSLKLVQKIALTVLPPRNPKWKYQKRSVSLLQNLGVSGSSTAVTSLAVDDQEEEDDEYDIPEETEDIIDLLQAGLGEKDTIVRWSAAKGIGRVTNRLPMSLADEVVGAIIDIFNPRESDSSWHGACLAIAELARRGLLLPARLPSIVPKIIEALNFEQKRGSHTIGAHVRDAACYVCWALARSYEPQVLQHVLSQGQKSSLAIALMTEAVFDREVNCRRAAAAAFQENVGRSGRGGSGDSASETFPHGLDIISIANFFTLSNRTESYLKIAVDVAAFEPYRRPLIDHLIAFKVGHVDMALRDIASKSLHRLVPLEPSYFVSTVLPRLLPSCVHPTDVFLRQGALLAVGEIISAIGRLPTAQKPLQMELVPLQMQRTIRDLPDEIDRNRLYRGKGAEWIRIAVCKLIQAVSEAGISLKKEDIPADAAKITGAAAKGRLIRTTLQAKSKPPLQAYLDTLEEGLKNPQETVQLAAVEALREFSKVLVHENLETSRIALVDRFIKLATSKDAGPASWRGYSLALGCFPVEFVPRPNVLQLVDTLLVSAKIPTDVSMRDAETRRNSVVALREIIASHGLGALSSHTGSIFETLFVALDDYSADNRGDIGSWVREASIVTLDILVHSLLQQPASGVPSHAQIFLQLVHKLIKQTAEKMDKMRELAGRTLQTLLQNSLFQVPRRLELLESINVQMRNYFAVSGVKRDSMEWSSCRSVFSLLSEWMSMHEYVQPILAGLVRSIGGKNNSRELLNDAIGALTTHVESIRSSETKISQFGEQLVKFWDHHQSNNTSEIQSAAFYRVYEVIFATDVFSNANGSITSFVDAIGMKLQKEHQKVTRISKSIERLCGFSALLAAAAPLPNATDRDLVLSLLLLQLDNKYPVVRKATSEAFFALLSVFPHVVHAGDEPCHQVLALLRSFHWDTVTDEERAKHLLELHSLLKIAPPKSIVPASPVPQHQTAASTIALHATPTLEIAEEFNTLQTGEPDTVAASELEF